MAKAKRGNWMAFIRAATTAGENDAEARRRFNPNKSWKELGQPLAESEQLWPAMDLKRQVIIEKERALLRGTWDRHYKFGFEAKAPAAVAEGAQ